jgi:hypothetical protein
VVVRRSDRETGKMRREKAAAWLLGFRVEAGG